MPNYKVSISYETTVEADDENDAEEQAVDGFNFGDANYDTEEVNEYADLSDGEILDIVLSKFGIEDCGTTKQFEILMQRIVELDQLTVSKYNELGYKDGDTKTFKNFSEFMEFSNSFQMSPLPDEYEWWITKPDLNQ